MCIENVISSILAIATFCLAIAAFKTINENKKWNIIGKSPILEVSLKKLDFMGQNLYQLVEFSCKNVGFGPAYNINVLCYQGTNKYKIDMRKQFLPLNLNVDEQKDLMCNLDVGVAKEENREKPFIIDIVSESIFKKQVKQKFELPLSTQGEFSSVILKSINFGV